ncbi:fimbrillin family protein [Ornithinimicrobium pekingense]|nr:fimbrillin family protein [Ornithinimicrobium pekingense]
MKFSRMTAAVTLASALVLTACSGDDETDDASTPASGATSEGAATGGPGDDGSATSAADGDSATATAATDDAAATSEAMTTDEGQAAMSVEDAEAVAATVMEARHESFQGDGDEVTDAQRSAFMGSARTAVEAADQLEEVFGEPAETEADAAPEPNVLAISREDGDLPEFLLVQTVPADEVPVLHLLESRTGEDKDFRIIWEARMLPGTEVPTFDRRSVGTPVLREGQGTLLANPRDTLKELGAYISWPQPEDIPDYRTHGYSPAVRKAAEEQAAAVADQASLREKNWLVSDDTKTLMFEDGSAFVIGTLLRDTTFTVNANSVLTAPESFVALAGDDEITDEAVLRTMVFVGMRVPAEGVDFKPEMIAAREQLVEAWGE